jgi:uncharacterized protein YbjT (DUF2867 family)
VTVAVVGASGKTGRAVTAALESQGESVRAVGRRDWLRLADALTGCRAISVIAPNLHPNEPALVRDVLDAARSAGVDRVVYHSVAGPFAPSMPHHMGKARAEDAIRRSDTAWTILQPCAYLQNFVPGLLNDVPALRVPYDVHRLFGFVDLADVADATAAVLLGDGHVGATYELGGPRLVSVADVARAASIVLGCEVTACRIAPEEWASGAGASLSQREREWLVAMFAYYDHCGLPAGSLTLRALLAGDVHSLEQTLSRELYGHGRA